MSTYLFIPVELDESLIHVCKIIAKLRSDANGGKNFQSDFHGLLGEMAFAKHFNLYLDLSIGKRINTYDFRWNGKRIDIKTNNKIDGDLFINERENIDVDVYVLALLDERKPQMVYLAGYIPKEIIRTEQYKFEKKFIEGTKVKYKFPQEELIHF